MKKLFAAVLACLVTSAFALTNAELDDKLGRIQLDAKAVQDELKARETPPPPPPPAPVPLEVSADGTTIPAATRIVDADKAVWSVVDGKVLRNGKPHGYSANVAQLLLYDKRICQKNTAGSWYCATADGWVAVPRDPRRKDTEDVPPPAPPPPGPQAEGKLRVDGKYFKDANDNVVVLRGVSTIGLEYTNSTRGGFPFIFDLLTDATKGWHAKLIRLPVFHPDGYFNNPAGFVANTLDPAVKRCTDRKIYCIVDLHYFESPYGVTAKARQFWADIAPRYKDNPYILYEIFNEPITGGSNTQAEWDKWKDWAQDIVNIIRSKAPDNIILVGGPHFSSIMRGAVSNPVSGKNIAYVGHIYSGSYHPDAAGLNWNNTIGWDYQIGAVAAKYPVVITEWGFDPGSGYIGPGGESLGGTVDSFAKPFKAWAEKYGVSWTAWTADWDWAPPMFNRDYSPNVFGNFAQKWLAEKK